MEKNMTSYQGAVEIIKTAILKSQEQAVKAVNQEQLALYYGIGRYISENTRNKNWGTGAIKAISEQLRSELPGLRGFGESHLKNMRLFYEAWKELDGNSPIAIGKIESKTIVAIAEMQELTENKQDAIRQLRLANLPDFPIAALPLSATKSISISWDTIIGLTFCSITAT